MGKKLLVKVRFIKYGIPSGREYTYRSQIPLVVGDTVELPNNGTGIVTEIDVPESKVESYAEKIKDIIGLMEGRMDDGKRID